MMVVREETKARQGATGQYVRYVLGVSLALGVIVLAGAVLVVG